MLPKPKPKKPKKIDNVIAEIDALKDMIEECHGEMQRLIRSIKSYKDGKGQHKPKIAEGNVYTLTVLRRQKLDFIPYVRKKAKEKKF